MVFEKLLVASYGQPSSWTFIAEGRDAIIYSGSRNNHHVIRLYPELDKKYLAWYQGQTLLTAVRLLAMGSYKITNGNMWVAVYPRVNYIELVGEVSIAGKKYGVTVAPNMREPDCEDLTSIPQRETYRDWIKEVWNGFFSVGSPYVGLLELQEWLNKGLGRHGKSEINLQSITPTGENTAVITDVFKQLQGPGRKVRSLPDLSRFGE